jgi:translation initiation factor RLI1
MANREDLEREVDAVMDELIRKADAAGVKIEVWDNMSSEEVLALLVYCLSGGELPEDNYLVRIGRQLLGGTVGSWQALKARLDLWAEVIHDRIKRSRAMHHDA